MDQDGGTSRNRKSYTKEPWRNKRKQSRKRWTFPLRSDRKGWESIGKGAPADGGSRVAGRQEGLIVAIDELDRCRPSYAVELLEVAKHLFSVDRIVFVLAVNLDQLAHSVRALYGSDFDAKGYLRRFVDVDFYLPDPDRDAFIREQLRATEIADYFDKTPLGEKLRTMLQKFFGASDLSLRTVGQAICRLGLLYALLRSDQYDYALAMTVALILRTIDPDLYHRFCRSEATDLDVVKTIFGHPSLKNLQHEEWGAEFESTIILAVLSS